MGCFIAFFGISFGSVNVLAPLLTMVSLISYGVLNLSAGMETLIANPSWRPRFRVHWIISLSGVAMCLITMLMIDAGYALLSLLLVALIYLGVKKRQCETSWSDIRDGLFLYFSRLAIYRLSYAETPSKSWRPHFLVFTKSSDEHSISLLKFAHGISQSKGFLTMASFVVPGTISMSKRKELSHSLAKQFKKNNIQALVQIKESEKITHGMYNMIEHHGLGTLAPNTIVFGGIKKEDESIDFVKVLSLAYRRHNNIVILNGSSKLDGEEAKNIHIWFDEQNRQNSALMLVLGYMLQLDPARKRSRLCVKGVVSSELDRKDKIRELNQISIEKRLPIDVEVYVAQDPAKDRALLVNEFSKDADMIFLGLKSPPTDFNSMQAYVAYLHELFQNFEGVAVAFVLSSEFTPLDIILE